MHGYMDGLIDWWIYWLTYYFTDWLIAVCFIASFVCLFACLIIQWQHNKAKSIDRSIATLKGSKSFEPLQNRHVSYPENTSEEPNWNDLCPKKLKNEIRCRKYEDHEIKWNKEKSSEFSPFFQKETKTNKCKMQSHWNIHDNSPHHAFWFQNLIAYCTIK